LLQSFYNWLIANATWQEKFITSGLWSFKEDEFKLPENSLNSWNGEFCLYDIYFNTATNEIYKGFYVKNYEIQFKTTAGDFITVYQDSQWINDKYKNIFFNANYHIDDDNYDWLIKNAQESKVLSSGVKWQFNNIIDLTNFPKENIELKFGLFETISGTKNL
jgi:hypothetical protein